MYHIIVNPASRSGKSLRIWRDKIEPILIKENVPYTVHFSKEKGGISKIAAELSANARASQGTQYPQENEPLSLIILGGDGTMNEAVQEIPTDASVTIGYIPTGSSNDLARDLGIPRNPVAALELILHTGSPRPMDLGILTYPDGESQRFCVSCGLGYDAAVCEEAQRSRIKTVLNKLGLGKLTYLGIALKQLFAAKAISGRLTLDSGDPIDIGTMLFVTGMNHRFEGGGFMFCPKADDSDGLLDLCAAGNLPKLLVLFALPTAFKGKHYRFQGITPYRAERFVLEADAPLWVHTDGEVSCKAERISVACLHHAVQIIAPGQKP